jgi:hypothetical protein
MPSQKFTTWIPDADADEVRRITKDERRGSDSKTIAALAGEAIEARKKRAEADTGTRRRG